MGDDYMVTIFSRRRGKTYSFSVGRRLLFYTLLLLVFLVVSVPLLGRGLYREWHLRRHVQAQIAALESEIASLRDLMVEQLGSAQGEEAGADTDEQQQVSAEEEKSKETEVGATARVAAPSQEGAGARNGPAEPVYARVELPVVTPESDKGFRLDFKLVNLAPEPIAGAVAIVAARKPPLQPRYVSFPPMELNEGFPVQLRKSVSFYIRRFKYVGGRFFFPFSLAESFRILIFDPQEKVMVDKTFAAEEITVNNAAGS